MRKNEWVLLSAFALMLPVAACKHGDSADGSSSVTTRHSGMSDSERAEAQESESTKAISDAEQNNRDGYSATASIDKDTTTDRTVDDQLKTDEKYSPDLYAADKTTQNYASDAGSAGTPSAGTTTDTTGAGIAESGASVSGTTGNTSAPGYRGAPGKNSDKMIGAADATATLSSVGPASQVSGVVGLKKTKNGARLTVHISDADPGRYAIQILESGSCSELDDTNPRGTEETTGGGMTTGAKTPASNKKILARIDVKKDRTGHKEMTLTRGQLGTKNLDDLQQRVVVIREDKKTASPLGGTQTTAPDTGIMACGTIEAADAG